MTPADSLWTALLAFQSDPPHIPLDATNPHFGSRFPSLKRIMELVRPKLADHGLVWTTLPSQDANGRPTLRYKLAHAPSGECEQGEMPLLPAKSDPQALGSSITYGRRYSVLAVLGLVGDDDDDGNAGSAPNGSAAAPNVPFDGGGEPLNAFELQGQVTQALHGLDLEKQSWVLWTALGGKEDKSVKVGKDVESVSRAIDGLSVDQSREALQIVGRLRAKLAREGKS